MENLKTQKNGKFHSISIKDGEFVQKMANTNSNLAAVKGVIVAAFSNAAIVGELPVVLLLFRCRWWRRLGGDEVDKVAGDPGGPFLRLPRDVRHLPIVLVDGEANEKGCGRLPAPPAPSPTNFFTDGGGGGCMSSSLGRRSSSRPRGSEAGASLFTSLFIDTWRSCLERHCR
jgi:hypothetical protein